MESVKSVITFENNCLPVITFFFHLKSMCLLNLFSTNILHIIIVLFFLFFFFLLYFTSSVGGNISNCRPLHQKTSKADMAYSHSEEDYSVK